MSKNILDALVDLAEDRVRAAQKVHQAKRKRWRLICGELYMNSNQGRVAIARANAERMSAAQWRNVMVQAVQRGDARVLESLAERLGKSELAVSILRAKGYGAHGQSIDLTVRDIPSRND
ncbi:hypothetical protein [Massilia soli]|uniref:Uncharacterized protein n=1 Tax=Massilia soli TaxID=2792854 RepID=A0ABS7SUL8_9BURK|nr:hypothetical protein [Massilia soli]MBZ2209649.1 hypothetical protein [Massilia soli]